MSTIRVADIPDEGLHLEFHATRDAWVRDTLHHALHEQFLPDDNAQVTLTLVRAGEEHISLIGGLYVHMHAVCDRCLKEFPVDQQIPLHMILAPTQSGEELESGKAWKEEGTADDDDECQFGLYQGGEIDLRRIITEQVVLAQPMQSLCVPTCRGLCDHCGQDLNEGPCACVPQPAGGPFSKLAKMRLSE